MLSCKDVTRLVSESLDQTLPIQQRIALRIHFLLCKLCDRYRRHLLFIRNAVRKHPERLEGQEAPSSTTLSPEARERLKRSLTEDKR